MFHSSSIERETNGDSAGGSTESSASMASSFPQHVTVIQSCNPSNDQALFETFFGFKVEQQQQQQQQGDCQPQQNAAAPETIILTRNHQCVVLLPVSPKSPPSPSSSSAVKQNAMSILIFDESTMTNARTGDAAAMEGLPKVEWNTIPVKSKTNDEIIAVPTATIILSTGHILIATTLLGWKTPSARAKVVQFAATQQRLATPTLTRRPSFGSKLFSSVSKRKVALQRQSSLSSSPPSVSDDISEQQQQTPPNNKSTSEKSSRSFSPTNSSRTSSTNGGGIRNMNAKLFPSLDIRALTPGGEFGPFAANSQVEVPIESDLFVGSMILLIRPNDPTQDPYWNERIFSKKKRRVILFLQGKLKYTPEGPLYSGLEINQPMKLGLMASGLCNLILTFIQKFDPSLHYSFGDKEESAHMTSTVECFFDQIVVTHPGETPPKLGEDLNEPAESVKARKASKQKIQWNNQDTYSLAFHTMYVDFPSWTTSNVPLVRDMKLQTFWGNSLLNIVLYEMDHGQKRHIRKDIKYIMSIQLKYLKPHERQNNTEEEYSIGLNSSEEESSEMRGDSSWGALTVDDEVDFSFREDPTESAEVDESEEFFDTVQIDSNEGASLPNTPPTIGASFSPAFVLSAVDEYCPFMIEMHSQKKSYETVYVFRGRYSHSRPIFRDVRTAREALVDCRPSINEEWFSPRLTDIERTRRIIALMYMKGLTDKDVEIQQRTFAFQTKKSTYDRKFLKGFDSKKKNKKQVKPYFAVARALSDHHWVEEMALLSDRDIQFYRVDKKKPGFSIGLSSIIKVKDVDSTSMLQGYYHILAIETFGRTTYLMFPSKEERFRWSHDIQEKAKAKNGLLVSESLTNHLINVDDPAREFLHRSTMFDCSKRKILNCRRFSFQAPKPTSSEDTLLLAEQALIKATGLQSSGSDTALTDFLDCAAALKDANARDLNDDERMAFFLNVYHVVIMHAFIVLGPPKNGLEWLTYFNNFAYQCSDDIFSLTELEHNIIRAKMNFPSQFFSRFVMPKSQFGFALAVPDVRINFALNSGSLSMPTAAVPIYQAETINEQLDSTVLKFARRSVFFNYGKKKDVTVTLPKICQWFASDFGDGSTSDILKMLQPYLDQEKQATLERLWSAKKQAFDVKNVKFLPFMFECRFLTLEEQSNFTIE
ncbi:unnamed protein product [Cylindrotheca closterium]|uniref:DUF547 domain-containing protein n=1 Tax=Cylindrotheca closterium TaxID=2856 RepID=A0AAD2FZX7_9STRA|nr:unnamed protein product [Cylindrotheca closterium]